MKRLIVFISFLALLVMPNTALAAQSSPSRERGLLITPLRQFLNANAGTTVKSNFSITNLTDKPLTVSLSVQQFSVTDYVYNYQFKAPKNDWLTLGLTSIVLQPNQTQLVPYTINPPVKSAPGGHYYTLFASADLASQGVQSTIQAADLIYFTANGQLTSVSHLQSSSIRRINFDHTIPFNLNAIDTGNEHVFVYVSGELHGPFVRPSSTSAAHLLIPGTVRSLQGDIQSPVLPGIYKAIYGYKTDAGWIIQESSWVVYIPPWSIAFLLAAILLVGRFWHRLRPLVRPPTS